MIEQSCIGQQDSGCTACTVSIFVLCFLHDSAGVLCYTPVLPVQAICILGGMEGYRWRERRQRDTPVACQHSGRYAITSGRGKIIQVQARLFIIANKFRDA